MDRALRERIIGAIVLVVFAILVVPIFLDGRSGDGEIISETVTLPGQNNQERKQQTIVLERDRTEPVPSAENSTPDIARTEKVVEKKPTQVAKAETSPAPEPPAASRSPTTQKGESSTGMWAVQLGSFSNQENAERLAADLRSQGYAAFLSQLKTDSGSLHRVRVGPQKDRESAESVAKQLNTGGHKGQVVPHP